MLLRTLIVDLDRARVILAEEVLQRIEIVLGHVAETAGIVVPVAAERGAHAVVAVRTPRRRTKPHLVVEALRNRIHGRVDATGPAELPAEALADAKHAAHRFTLARDQIILDHLANRLHRRAETVERILEAEPRIDAEHALLGLYDLHHTLAFANRAGHRLLAPDVLPRLRGHHALDAVPVRRRADVNDVHARIGEELEEVLVGLDLAPARRLGALESLLHTVVERVAKTHEARPPVRQVILAVRDHAEADERTRELVGRRRRAPQHAGRDEVEGAERTGRFQEFSSVRFHLVRRSFAWLISFTRALPPSRSIT